MATLTNQNGTSSVDTLTYNKAGTYHAGAGNDTIKIEGGSGIVVYTDSGNNIVNVTGGSLHTVKVAVADADSEKQNGVEKLAINGANQVDAYLGSGKDEIILRYSDGRKSNGALSQIHGGGWTDTFTVGNGAQRYQLYGDAGNDIFEINAGSNIVCWGGAANDTFNVTGGTAIKLRGGDSADVYNIKTGAQAVDMQLGYGNDEVNVEAGDKHTIKANLGINTINLKAGSGHVITSDIDQAASKKVGKDVGYGVDKLFMDGANEVTANLGDGKDEVTVSNGSNHKIYTEGWGDTITVNKSVSNSIFDAGAGDDLIQINGGSKNTFIAGEGNDTINVKGTEGLATVKTTAGKNTVNIASGWIELFAEGSKDVVNVKSGNHNLNGGSGLLEVNVSGGSPSVSAGTGKVTAKVTGGSFAVNFNYDSAPIDLTLDDGKVGFVSFKNGDDYVTLNGGTIENIDTKGGSDTVVIWGGTITSKKVYTGFGNDTIFVYGGQGNTIMAEDGDDMVFVVTEDGVNANNKILTGFGNDSVFLSGEGNEVNTGSGQDGVIVLSCKNTTLNLGEDDDTVTTLVGDYLADSISIKGEKGGDSISLQIKANNSTIDGGDDDDTIVVGYGTDSTYTGNKNKIYGGYGYDNISAINQTNAFVDGGLGVDTITCNRVTRSVIQGGEGGDTFNLSGVQRSYVEADSKDAKNNNHNKINTNGNIAQSIICGGNYWDEFTINGSSNGSIFLGCDGYNKFSIQSGDVSLNRFYGGKNDDVFEVKAGSHNTYYAGRGATNNYNGEINVFKIKGGSQDLYVGSNTKNVSQQIIGNLPYTDEFYVYSGMTEYSMIQANEGRNLYSVDARARIIIDNYTNHDEYADLLNLAGTDMGSVDVAYDKDNDILKLNNIYIRGTYLLDFRCGAFDVESLEGKWYSTSDLLDLKLGKTHVARNLYSEYATRISGVGCDQSYVVSLSDIAYGLEEACDGITTRASQVLASYAKV